MRTQNRAHASSGWAVVGLGSHARGRMLPALARAGRSRLVGVYTRTAAVAREVADAYGVRAYEAFDVLLADPAVQIVYLATPNDLHAEQTIRCAEAGKHVLVEKPLALSHEDGARMIRACGRAGVGLYVGFHLRFHPAHRKVRALVAQGTLGEVVWAGARWASSRPPDAGWRLDPDRSGGTLLTARGVHLIDLVRFACGTEFATIDGASDGLRTDRPVDDLTVAMGGLATGAFASLLCTRLVPGVENGLEIYGTRGTAICRSTVAAEPQGTLTVAAGSERDVMSYQGCDVLAAQFDWVGAALAGSGEPGPLGATGEDGMRVVDVTLGLIESARTGRRVALD